MCIRDRFVSLVVSSLQFDMLLIRGFLDVVGLLEDVAVYVTLELSFGDGG